MIGLVYGDIINQSTNELKSLIITPLPVPTPLSSSLWMEFKLKADELHHNNNLVV